MKKKIFLILTIVTIIFLLIFVFYRIISTPEHKVKAIIEIIKQNKLNKVKLNQIDIIKIQNMLSLKGKGKPDMVYLKNPKIDGKQSRIAVFFNYYLIINNNKLEIYKGTLEFHLEKISFKWVIKEVVTIKSIEKQ